MKANRYAITFRMLKKNCRYCDIFDPNACFNSDSLYTKCCEEKCVVLKKLKQKGE